jgi:hypothetical protein
LSAEASAAVATGEAEDICGSTGFVGTDVTGRGYRMIREAVVGVGFAPANVGETRVPGDRQ